MARKTLFKCSACGEYKPITSRVDPLTHNTGGDRSICKDCHREITENDSGLRDDPRKMVVSVSGDEIAITFDDIRKVWVAPFNGSQYGEPKDAMRAELSRYYSDCGEDLESEDVIESIETHIRRMREIDAH